MRYWVSLLVSMALCSTSALAGPGGMGTGMGRGRLVRELGLTDEQKEALACETPGHGREIRDEFQAEREKLNDMLRGSEASTDAIRTQLERVNALQARWNNHRIEKMLRAREVLTPEQMKRLLELQREDPDRQGHGHEE